MALGIPAGYNIIELISDQHQAGLMGCAGHSQAITPNLDRLATDGIRFTNAYTQNPICLPSRVSILSGQYCHNHGYYAESGPAPYELPTFFSHFKQHGYRTAAVGKIHVPDEPHSWLQDHLILLGEYLSRAPYNAYRQWSFQQGFHKDVDHGRIHELPGDQQHEARASKLTFEQSVEGFTVGEACRFLGGKRAARPFIIQVSLFRPHQCYTPAKQFWDMYPEELELPPGLMDDQSHRAPHFRFMVDQYRKGQGEFEPKDFLSWARRVWRGYLASITHCDHALGILRKTLEEREIADKTIIVYHSDHGGYIGTYGIPEKAPGICSHAVCKVPMIWYVPGMTRPGSVCDQLVENIDLAPTFCSLAGLPQMSTTDGVDISSLLAGENRPVRRVAVTENVWSKSIRWDRWRLVHYQPEMFNGTCSGELYDVDADPHERNNLFNSAAHAQFVNQGRQLLLEWLIRTTRARTVPMNRHPSDPDNLGMQAPDGTRDNKYSPAESLRRGMPKYL